MCNVSCKSKKNSEFKSNFKVDWNNVDENFKQRFLIYELEGDRIVSSGQNTNKGHLILTILNDIASDINKGLIDKNTDFKDVSQNIDQLL